MASGSTMAVSSNAEKSSPPSDLTVTPTVSNTDEVTNNQLKMLIVNLDKTMSQGMKDLDNKITHKIDELTVRVHGLTDRVERVEGENVEFAHKIKNFETTQNAVADLTNKVKQLEQKLEYNELRDRKYNILIYGIPEKSTPNQYSENTESIVREFICKDFVSNLVISNTHRLPRRGISEPGIPPAIIVKLATMRSRNDILGAARNIPRGTKISIRTDLPARLKEKRARLAKIAYDMRKQNSSLKTRIRESIPKQDVWLEFRNFSVALDSNAQTWSVYQET